MNDVDRYPKRERFYAMRFVRLLTKTAAAQELGADVCWLLTVVAMQEDAKRYTEPAKWYLDQLSPLCGFGSKRRLTAAIEKAVVNGWLRYVHGAKGIPGRFWVTIPLQFLVLDDAPCDESIREMPSQRETESAKCSSNLKPNPERKRNESGTQVERNGCASIPVPFPDPVSSASHNSYSDDFNRFWDEFPSGRKGKKLKAEAAFIKAVKKLKRVDAADFLVRRAKEYAASPKGRGEYVHGPEPWLNGGCWDDAPEAWGLGDRPVQNNESDSIPIINGKFIQ